MAGVATALGPSPHTPPELLLFQGPSSQGSPGERRTSEPSKKQSVAADKALHQARERWAPVLPSGSLCGLGRVNFPLCVFTGLRVKEERISDLPDTKQTNQPLAFSKEAADLVTWPLGSVTRAETQRGSSAPQAWLASPARGRPLPQRGLAREGGVGAHSLPEVRLQEGRGLGRVNHNRS